MEEIAALILGAALALAGVWLWRSRMTFKGQRARDYAFQHPDFDLRSRLSGDLACEGVIFGPTGRVTSRFVADVTARWQGGTGTMREHFRYDSGATQDREWRITLLEDGHFRAEADDVIGVGVGKTEGPTLSMRYRVRLPDDVGGHVLSATDWMYLMENGTIVNRSQFRLFGVKVAELMATFRKVGDR